MDRLNRMLQAAQGMGMGAGSGPGGVSTPVAFPVSPCVFPSYRARIYKPNGAIILILLWRLTTHSIGYRQFDR